MNNTLKRSLHFGIDYLTRQVMVGIPVFICMSVYLRLITSFSSMAINLYFPLTILILSLTIGSSCYSGIFKQFVNYSLSRKNFVLFSVAYNIIQAAFFALLIAAICNFASLNLSKRQAFVLFFFILLLIHAIGSFTGALILKFGKLGLTIVVIAMILIEVAGVFFLMSNLRTLSLTNILFSITSSVMFLLISLIVTVVIYCFIWLLIRNFDIA